MRDVTALIAAISDRLRKTPQVRALCLGGSRGTGLEDIYSDIDFIVVGAPGMHASFATWWREALEAQGALVLWRERHGAVALINAILDDWTRIDVQVIADDRARALGRGTVRVLFDHDDVFADLPAAAGPGGPDRARLAWQFEEFIRILGLLAVAVGRDDALNGITGLGHLRGLLIELMIEETGAPNRGGALHLGRLITEEQQRALKALPWPRAEREEVIAAHLAYAAAYLARARGLADRLGIAWPEVFETATRRHLKVQLDIDVPASVASGET